MEKKNIHHPWIIPERKKKKHVYYMEYLQREKVDEDSESMDHPQLTINMPILSVLCILYIYRVLPTTCGAHAKEEKKQHPPHNNKTAAPNTRRTSSCTGITTTLNSTPQSRSKNRRRCQTTNDQISREPPLPRITYIIHTYGIDRCTSK